MNRKWLLVGVLSLLLFITIGFCSINKTLKFENNQQILLTNIKPVTMTNKENLIIEETQDGVNYNINLEKPGDYYSFTIDLINNTSNKQKIDSIELPSLTEKQQKYFEYKVTYLNGEEIREKDIIESNSKITLKVSLHFRKDITVEDLPIEADVFDLSLHINTSMAD